MENPLGFWLYIRRGELCTKKGGVSHVTFRNNQNIKLYELRFRFFHKDGNCLLVDFIFLFFVV